MAGSTPHCAHDTIFARGSMPLAFAVLPAIKQSAAAPSLIPDAFPAVTVPSFLKAGFKFASFSTVVPSFGYSSLSNTTSSFFIFTVMGTISSLNFFDLIASIAFLCEAAAKVSWSCRVI